MKLAILRNKLIKQAEEYTDFLIEINKADLSNFDFKLDDDKIFSELRYLLGPLDQYVYPSAASINIDVNISDNIITITGKTKDFPKLEKEIKNIFPNATILNDYFIIKFVLTKEINILKFLSKIKTLVNNIHYEMVALQKKYNCFNISFNISDDTISILFDLIEEETGERPRPLPPLNKCFLVSN